MGSKLEEIGRYVEIGKVLDYVEKRRHDDGGYCFVSVLDDTNVNDTYYAVKLYNLLGLEVPEKEKTIEFLSKAIQPQTAVVAIAMALEGLSILGARDIAREHVDIVFTKYNPIEGRFAVGLGGSEEFGTATPLEATYWVVKALKAIGYRFSNEERDAIRRFVMRFRNGNGYGVKQPTTTMTYQALYTLNALGYRPPKSPHFRNCELCPMGGFTEVPYSLPSYLEPTFYGIRGLELQGETPTCPEGHVRFIRRLQNPNGGFRRSLELGISNFQNTYRALAVVDSVLRFL
ncbi:prenyltransferase/squalene oxidase repeat-containing protein [Thermococcus sp.]|uniref:prenyltransferase/squalene oxidase repeat-containing protein n=1 Tax=Thermococcus sp. TaxID=35749 RepID=UPI0026338203|nr:prenyltransferase/squalene oxidase repeat-containing protein [Thermococcus sp.]